MFITSSSFSLGVQATDRTLEGRVSKMKGQEFTYRSQLDEINDTANRLQSLGNQYQKQVQDTRRLIQGARLDLEQSRGKLGGVASILPCGCSLPQGVGIAVMNHITERNKKYWQDFFSCEKEVSNNLILFVTAGFMCGAGKDYYLLCIFV